MLENISKLLMQKRRKLNQSCWWKKRWERNQSCWWKKRVNLETCMVFIKCIQLLLNGKSISNWFSTNYITISETFTFCLSISLCFGSAKHILFDLYSPQFTDDGDLFYDTDLFFPSVNTYSILNFLGWVILGLPNKLHNFQYILTYNLDSCLL